MSTMVESSMDGCCFNLSTDTRANINGQLENYKNMASITSMWQQ